MNMITNVNYRRLTEDELAEYHEEMQRLMHLRKEAKKWANNTSKHVLDPSREWGEEE